MGSYITYNFLFFVPQSFEEVWIKELNIEQESGTDFRFAEKLFKKVEKSKFWIKN